jgi:hypothetical protein
MSPATAKRATADGDRTRLGQAIAVNDGEKGTALSR